MLCAQAAFELLLELPVLVNVQPSRGYVTAQPQALTQDAGLLVEGTTEGTVLGFIKTLLALHMDKAQQGQLMQAWVGSVDSSALTCWQSFLAECGDSQVRPCSFCSWLALKCNPDLSDFFQIEKVHSQLASVSLSQIILYL